MADLKSRRRARKLADERQLVGLANDTKWGEFFQEMVRLEIPLELKLLYEDEPLRSQRIWIPVTNYVDGEFGPNLFVFVEWARSNVGAEVTRIATSVGLEYSIEETQITVYGYK